MFTCKDCAHYEACQEMYDLLTSLEDIDMLDNKYAEQGCLLFKNKADFVEVKRGEWVRQKGRPEAICSGCGREVVYQIIDNKWRFENFCPYCGADMRKEGADNG